MTRFPLQTRETCIMLVVAVLVGVLISACHALPSTPSVTRSGVCFEFIDAASPWHAAQQNYADIPATDSTSPAALDSDGDGLACEHLALVTPVDGEPDCYDTSDGIECSGRNHYRAVTLLAPIGKHEAIRGAVLDTFMPYAANPNIEVLIADTFGAQDTACIRAAVLQFITERSAAQASSQAFVDLIGIGQEAMRRRPNHPYEVVADRYLDLAKEVLAEATALVVAGHAINTLGYARGC